MERFLVSEIPRAVFKSQEAGAYDLSESAAKGAGVFHSFSQTEEVLDADIVIVGSGAGGGVVALKLAGLGKKVVVVEKGECILVEQMPVEQLENERIYDGEGGAFVTADGKGTILAGSNWGGSTTVNLLGSLEVSCADSNERRVGLMEYS
jgi:glutamate dehydrogenase/leucine dehydrogenase